MDTEEMKKVHHPTEQEVYDLLANLELAGLPSALIVTGLSPEVFKDNQAKVNAAFSFHWWIVHNTSKKQHISISLNDLL